MKKFLPTFFGLRSAVIFLVVLPLLVTFGLGSLILLATLEQTLEERMQEDIELIGRTLKEPVARALDRDRERSLDRALRSTFEFGRVYGAYVYGSDGELIARADDISSEDSPTLHNLDIEQEETKGTYRSMAGREVYSYFTPLTDAGGQVIGMLQVTRRASDMREDIATTRQQALMIMFGFSVIFITIIVLGHHFSIGKPLRRLAETMQGVAGGDTSVRAEPLGPAEIRWLSERLNAMIDGIARRDEALAEERHLQSRLQAQLRASEKYALVGRLAAGVAHELGSPLSVIDGHVQRLLRRTSESEDEHTTLLRMREASARMSDIVERLLGFGGESSSRLASVSVQRLVVLAVADARGAFEPADIRLEVSDGETDTTIMVDEGRVRESLVHLLKNAAYAARGGIVRIGWETSGNRVFISVEDSGTGIAEDDRERVFEPFFTTKPPGEGSGLGLAIVKGIILAHGGEISVGVSELGGAAFNIEFDRKVMEE